MFRMYSNYNVYLLIFAVLYHHNMREGVTSTTITRGDPGGCVRYENSSMSNLTCSDIGVLAISWFGPDTTQISLNENIQNMVHPDIYVVCNPSGSPTPTECTIIFPALFEVANGTWQCQSLGVDEVDVEVTDQFQFEPRSRIIDGLSPSDTYSINCTTTCSHPPTNIEWNTTNAADGYSQNETYESCGDTWRVRTTSLFTITDASNGHNITCTGKQDHPCMHVIQQDTFVNEFADPTPPADPGYGAATCGAGCISGSVIGAAVVVALIAALIWYLKTKGKLKIDPMNNVIIGVGEDARFQTKVHGNPSHTVAWYSDEVQLKPTETIKIDTEDQKESLTIKRCQPAQSGIITIKASAGKDRAEQRVLLTVKPNDEVKPSGNLKICTMDNVTIRVGQEAKFETAVLGNPPPTVTWYNNDEQLSSSQTTKILSNGVKEKLIIKNCQPGQSGRITIQANAGTDSAEQIALLTVKAMPGGKTSGKLNIDPMDNATIGVGEVATFETNVHGNPEHTVAWYHEECHIKASTTITMNTQEIKKSLTMKDCQVGQSGIITIKASAGKDRAEQRVLLTVKPKDEEKPSGNLKICTMDNVTIRVGQEAKFETAVLGNPPPTVTWYNNDEQLRSSQTTNILSKGVKKILIIKNCQPGQSGIITIQANAGEYSTEQSALLTVQTLEQHQEHFGCSIHDENTTKVYIA